MNTTVRTLFLLIISIAGTGCNNSGKTEPGTEDLISKELPVEIYNQIKIEGAIDLNYECKPDEASYFRVEADDNILPLLDAKVKKETLIIKAKESINPARFTIYTNSPSLKYVETKGASVVNLNGSVSGQKIKIEQKGIGNITAEDLIFDKAEFYLRGSGNLILGGQIEKSKMEITGNGNIQAFELTVDELECRLNGNGNMEIHAADKLSIEIKGNGNLFYKGDPQITKQKIKGAGTVTMK